MSSHNEEIVAYERLLRSVTQLPPSQQHAPTFLEIAGYPHLENVASNILQFFLQPQGQHNLKELVLESLLALLSVPPQSISFAEVRREVTTQRGNRIDLVVKSETCILGIENKIYHAVHNDFADYWNYLETQRRGRTSYGVVLALDVPPPAVPLHNFHAITYKQLLDQINMRVGEIKGIAQEPYTVFLYDWMQTISRLTETTALDPQMLAFFSEYHDEIHRLLREAGILKDEMRQKVKTLADLLAPDVQTIPSLLNDGLWRDARRLVDVLYYDFNGGDGLVVATSVVVEPGGWRIEFHNRCGSVEQLERWLATRSIATRVGQGRDLRMIYGDAGLPYTTALPSIKVLVEELLSKIRG